MHTKLLKIDSSFISISGNCILFLFLSKVKFVYSHNDLAQYPGRPQSFHNFPVTFLKLFSNYSFIVFNKIMWKMHTNLLKIDSSFISISGISVLFLFLPKVKFVYSHNDLAILLKNHGN